MSNIPISSLPVAVSLDGSEYVPLVQGGTTKRATVADISTFPASGGSFVVATASPSLTGSRLLAAESGVTTVTDGGALSTITVGVATNGISDAKFRQSVGLSVVGRASNLTGNVADIAAGSDFNVLRRSGSAIGFGAIDLSQSGAVGSSILQPGNGGTGVNNGASTLTLGGSLSTVGAFTAQFTFTGNTAVTFPTSGTLATTSGPSLPAVVQGDLLYGSAVNVLSTLAKDANATRYLSNTGSSNNPAWAQVNLTNGVTGNLPLANGGLNASLTASNGGIFYSTATAGAVLSGTATANLPLLSGATAAPSWASISYPLSATSGGIPYFSSTSAMASSALLAQNQLVLGGGAGTAPATLGSLGTTTTVLHGNAGGPPTFGAVSLTADVSGILPLANGGTNANLTANNGGLVYSTASALAILAGTATANQIPLSGSNAAPSWSTATYPATASAGTILAAGSANVISDTATPTLGANGGTGGQITFNGSTSGSVALRVGAAAGTGIIFQLPNTNGASGEVLSTNGSGVLSWIAAGGTGTVTSITPGNGLTSTLTATAPGSALTTTGTLSGAQLVNAQTGTSYAIVDGDRAKLVTGTNSAAQAYTIAQAGAASAFQAGWYVDLQNRGSGPLVVTSSTSTIDGASTLPLMSGQGARIFSDGSNYFTQRGQPQSVPLPRGYVSGFPHSNNVSSPNTTIDIAVGTARDSTDAQNIVLPSAFTKTTGSFAVGTGNGALDTGSVANNTWYYTYAILRTDLAGPVDILFSASATSPTMPANYTYFRRIGSFKTASGSTNILPFTQVNDHWYWATSPRDVNTSSLGTSLTAFALSVPRVQGVTAIYSATFFAASTITLFVVPGFMTDTATLGGASNTGATAGGSIPSRTQVDSSGQIKAKSTAASTTLVVDLLGWVDPL